MKKISIGSTRTTPLVNFDSGDEDITEVGEDYYDLLDMELNFMKIEEEDQ